MVHPTSLLSQVRQVIFRSASQQHAHRLRSDRYSKPFTRDTLVRAVRRILDGKS